MAAKFSVKGTYNRRQYAQEYGRSWTFNLFMTKWAGSRNAREKITISGITNHLNHCVIFIVHTQFTNVAMGHRLETYAVDH